MSETPPARAPTPGRPRHARAPEMVDRTSLWCLGVRCRASLCGKKHGNTPKIFSPAAGYFSFPFSLQDYQGRHQGRSCDCTITTFTCVLDTHGRGRVRFPRSTIVTLDICMVTTVLQKPARAHINTNGNIYQYRQWHMTTSVNDSFTTMVMVPCAHRDMMCAVL